MRAFPALLALATTGMLNAQSPYRPFPETDAGWVEQHSWLGSNGPACSDFTWITCTRPTYFGSDTIIAGSTYQRLRYHGVCDWQQIGPPPPPPLTCPNSGSYSESVRDGGYIRQDVDARRVYMWDVNAQEEALLYDFTLGVGPYPSTPTNPMGDALQVVALDSLELNDGWHRTWVLGLSYNGSVTDSAFATVIEGVGSTFGILSPLVPPFENDDDLVCHSAQDDVVYPFQAVACDLTMGERPEASLVRFSASPNPTSGIFRINGPHIANAPFVVHDVLGAVVMEGLSRDGLIDASTWPSGAYTVRMLNAGDRSAGVLRVVKQ